MVMARFLVGCILVWMLASTSYGGSSRPSGGPGQARYVVISLPEEFAGSVNNLGQVLCNSADAWSSWLLWSQGTILLEGHNESTWKLNDRSEILMDNPPRVVSAEGSTELGRFVFDNGLAGGGARFVADMNNNGSVIGIFAGQVDDDEVPGLWMTASSQPIPLTPLWEYNATAPHPGLLENDLPPGSGIAVDRINDAGVIVGNKEAGCTIWYGPGSSEIVSDTWVSITGLNEYDQVIGRSGPQVGGIVWEAGTTTVFGPAAYPNAINSPSLLAAVQIVGGQWSPNVFRARLWQKSLDGSGNVLDWTGYDLNNLIPANSGWILNAAYSVNNSGLIVGGGTYTSPGDPNAQPQERAFLLLPLDITVKKQGVAQPPTDGVIVKNGDVIEIKLNDIPQEKSPLNRDQIVWHYRQLKRDGSFTDWQPFGAHGKGVRFEHTTTTGGIFQIKVVLIAGGEEQEHLYARKQDTPVNLVTDSLGNTATMYAKGQPDYVGVVDAEWQIAVRNTAHNDLGITRYAQSEELPAHAGRGKVWAADNKCNAFV